MPAHPRLVLTVRSVTLSCLLGLLGLLVLTACGGHGQNDTRGPVPWIDEPVQGAQLAQSLAPPTCSVGVLHVPRSEQHWGGVWNSAVAGYFMVENAGSATCELPVPSRVAAATGSGEQVGFDVGSLSAPPVILDPGARVQVQVSSPYDCGKPLLRSTAFSLSFPTGSLEVPDAHMAVQCAGSLIDFSGRGADASGSGTARTTPASRLQATITQVPGSVAAGDPVSYTVTLTNPSSTAVPLDPCPTYQEGIKGRPSSVRTYQLNCGPVGQVAAHSSVRFAMHLPLSSGLPSGAAVLDWRLQLPSGSVDTGQFASGNTRIR